MRRRGICINVFPVASSLRVHLVGRSFQIGLRILISQNMYTSLVSGKSCRFATTARRLCVPIECVSTLRACGMNEQSRSVFRRLASPWSRQTQSFVRRPTALALEILTTNPCGPLTPWRTMLTTRPWKIPRTILSQTRELASLCHTATKSVESRLWREG